MYIHTTEAAKLLGIIPRRLLDLLQKGRVVGAYKSGRCWIIPLFDGLPKIIPGKRGRTGTWKTTEVEKSNAGKKKPTQPLDMLLNQKHPSRSKEYKKKTIIHINSNHIRQNKKRKAEDRKPVIVIRGESKVYTNAVEIPYPCRIVYQPDNPLGCGARVWIEVLGFDLAAMQPPANVAGNVQ